MENRTYICIDLKSFYASVEAVERGLNPFKTNLVVADATRGRGAICLAITPAMKNLGVKNRCRLFEIPDRIEYIIAKPRMKYYMDYSAHIYSVYLKYISKEDIYVYSIDECFFDVTTYLDLYNKTPRELAKMLMDAVYLETGIASSAGIGTNLFLAKVALDVMAKQSKDRIGFLDRESFEKTVWHHRPITDIWNIGRGIAKRLEKHGIYDLYGVAHADEKKLYKEFGVNAEFLIDHSKGIEPCTIDEIKSYTPETTSMTNSQILFENYDFDSALLALKEMIDLIVLEMVDRGLMTNSISLAVGYSGREDKGSGGTRKLDNFTDSTTKLTEEFVRLFKEKTDRTKLIRRLTVGLNNLSKSEYVNLDFFTDYKAEEKERKKQQAIIDIKKKYGKNAVLKGMNLEKKATTPIRNRHIGGHNGE
ncbi:MAG: DNA methylase [Monoglobales bacterium]